MKTIRELGKASLIALAVLLSPTALYADDTEIFFSAAQADNDENKPIANVLIMLDTSGSMRWCDKSLSGNGGFDAGWCSDVSKRRINVLQDALKGMIDDVPDGVRLGLGRFNYRINNIWDRNSGVGRQGGRVLVPVTDVTEGTKAVMLQEIAKLNDAGNNASGPYPGAQPAGDTPTGLAYSEAARYMMGMAPKYGTTQNGAQTSVCLETATREVGCRDVLIGKENPNEVAFCDVNDELCTSEIGSTETVVAWCDTQRDACRVERGGWVNMATGDTCDLSDSESCRRSSQWVNMGYGETCNTWYSDCRRWSAWVEVRTRSSGANNSNCPRINRPTDSGNNYYQRRSGGRCFEGRRYYQQLQYQYQTRAVTYFEKPETFYQWEAIYEKQCDIETYCAKDEPIISGGKYVSPMNMDNQCETNHVILFTDGQPSSNDTPGNQGFVDCGSNSSYACQVRISNYLYSDNNAKKRRVKTYNIGLYMGGNQSSMESVSTDGASGTINADDSDELVKAFADIVNLIADNSRSFSAPGVAVNQMNRLEHLDQLYYAVFEPRKSSYWEGNLKRYRVVNDQIRAANGPAVDPATGFFSETSKSFWSSVVDGADVRKGGAREKVANRRLFYTDDFGATKQLDWVNDSTPTFYGLPASATTEQVTELKDMLKVTWGDPLHSEPVLVNYGGSSDNNRVFVSGNDGMLRAINSQTGAEVWAFMPNEMIRKANKFTVNRPGLALNNDRQIYGLDSSWTAWRRPGTTASSAPSKVYVYGGMRRGGTSYYALDATTTTPKLIWQIDRGDTGFERLGQTWSQPTLTQVKVGGTKRAALVFGGGYDPDAHDGKQDAGRSGGDSMGNIIYVVDALTGQLLWSAGANNATTTVASMKWSVPSTISVVDANFDGAADFFYFGDLGGQLFRVDLDDANVASSKVHRIADLSGTGVANNRRFYYAPSISYVRSEDGSQENLFISVGSGYRTHPLSEKTDDYFFVIRDDSVQRDASKKFVGSAPAAVLTTGSLDTLSGSGAADADKAGWKLPLVGDGEKSLSASVVFNNRIFFTTYQPTSEDDSLDGNDCAVRIGTTFLYVVDLVTGQGASLSNDGELGGDRRKELAQDVPPPSPTLLSDGEKVLIIIGTEVAGGESLGNTGVRRGSWYQLEVGEADKVPDPTVTPTPPRQ